MEGFNAEKAKRIASNVYISELESILAAIKLRAQNGEYALHLYKPINDNTKSEILKRGFDLKDHSSICIQKEGLYHSIYWV